MGLPNLAGIISDPVTGCKITKDRGLGGLGFRLHTVSLGHRWASQHSLDDPSEARR